jgi:hypothetical protein
MPYVYDMMNNSHLIEQVNGIFEIALKNKQGETESWIIDVKKVSQSFSGVT